MNTGIQRSSSTPRFADTTTTPRGHACSPGKGAEQKKNLTEDHGGPRHPLCGPDHVHRQSASDLHGEGPQGHLHPRRGVLERDSRPAPAAGATPAEKLIAAVAKAAVDTCVWPHVRGGSTGKYRPHLRAAPNKLPVADYLKIAGPLCPHASSPATNGCWRPLSSGWIRNGKRCWKSAAIPEPKAEASKRRIPFRSLACFFLPGPLSFPGKMAEPKRPCAPHQPGVQRCVRGRIAGHWRGDRIKPFLRIQFIRRQTNILCRPIRHIGAGGPNRRRITAQQQRAPQRTPQACSQKQSAAPPVQPHFHI